MKRFVVEDKFWHLFPEAKIGIVLCHGIDHTPRDQGNYEEMLRAAEKDALKYLRENEFSNNPVIRVWREAFQKFKTKKGARSSIEALLKRVQKGNSIGNINPLVDIYNSISLKYALPCGGEDMDTFVGDIRLTTAKGDEEFVPLGSEDNASPYEGEVVYKDDAGAICRCWNWREAMRTILTGSTRNAFLCIELVDETRYEEFEKAVKELAETVKANLGGNCESYILSIDNKEIVID